LLGFAFLVEVEAPLAWGFPQGEKAGHGTQKMNKDD
jgi:hypothetical protein